MRVIVTGPRDWPWPQLVYDGLNRVYQEHGPFTLKHGACSTGADFHAHHWYEVAGRDLGCGEIPYRAQWSRNGILDRSAGPKRNARMIASGVDLLLACLMPCTRKGCREPRPHNTHGTQGTIDLARTAGIEVREIRRPHV